MREKPIFLTENDEKWVLHYLVSGKGTIPYQMITDFDSLKRSSEEFFSYEDFYSDLKEKNISKEEYENVKKFCKILKLKTLGDLNRIYDFQDTAILCEIFEERSSLLQKLFKYNAIVQVLFQGVSKDFKASVQLHYQQMQKLLNFLKEQ